MGMRYKCFPGLGAGAVDVGKGGGGQAFGFDGPSDGICDEFGGLRVGGVCFDDDGAACGEGGGESGGAKYDVSVEAGPAARARPAARNAAGALQRAGAAGPPVAQALPAAHPSPAASGWQLCPMASALSATSGRGAWRVVPV